MPRKPDFVFEPRKSQAVLVIDFERKVELTVIGSTACGEVVRTSQAVRWGSGGGVGVALNRGEREEEREREKRKAVT